MSNKLIKVISIIVAAFVTWRISNALLEILYESIDTSIANSPDNVSNLLIALRVIVGILAFDITSFIIVVIGALVVTLKVLKD